MAVSMTNRTMPFVLGALFIIPVAGTFPSSLKDKKSQNATI